MKCAILSVAAALALAGSAMGYFEDFEAYNVGDAITEVADWGTWGNDAGTDPNTLVTDAVAAGGTRSLHLSPSSDLVLWGIGGPYTSGVVEIELDVYVPGNHTGDTEMDVLIVNGNDAGYDFTIFRGGGATYTFFPDFSSAQPTDEWGHIRFVYDLDAGLADYFYTDGGGTTWEQLDASIGLDQIGAIGFWQPASGTDMYIDNLSVVPEPAMLSLLGLGALALQRRRR